MSAPQFTPGPWLIHHKHRWIVPAEDAFKAPADALPICQLRDPDERLTEDETLDNGFLIAAAPELYEALRRSVEIIQAERDCVVECATVGPDHDLSTLDPGAERAVRDFDHDLAEFRAILAKARGEQVQS